MVKQHKCLSYQCFTVNIQTNISLEVTRLIMALSFSPTAKRRLKIYEFITLLLKNKVLLYHK